MSVVGWPVGPAPSPADLDEVGDMVQNNEGKNVGREIISTSLAGSWQGNSRSMLVLPPQTPGDKCSGRMIKEAGHGQMWFFLRPDGTFDAYADGNRDGGKIIRGAKFQGRLFKMTDYAFALVNGGHEIDKALWSASYYPVLLDGTRKHSTIFTMDTSQAFADSEECRDYGHLFVEQQWFGKVSDDFDLEIMRGVRRISDQWLWKPQDEDGPFGEQYPDTCTDPAPSC